MRIFEKIIYIFTLIFIGVFLGYGWRMYHENKFNLNTKWQLALLESQLKEAIEDRRPFFLAESNILIIPRADRSAILKIRGFSDEK